MPWWIRAYLFFGAAQALSIGVVGFVVPGEIQVPVPLTPLNARFIAGLYLAIAVAVILAGAVPHRADARLFVLTAAVATSLLLLVTLLHWPEFMDESRRHRPEWLGAYIADPILAVAVIWAARLLPLPAPARHRLTPLFLVEAVVLGGLGLLLLFAPSLGVVIWPWSMTPVLAQLYSCFVLAFALGALFAARETRPRPIRIFTITSLALMLLVLLASLLHVDRFRPGPATWVWFAALLLGAVAFTLALVWRTHQPQPLADAPPVPH